MWVVLKLETKYRDIADGNREGGSHHLLSRIVLETKYRDIADGNRSAACSASQTLASLETKYRDIADGNACGKATVPACREVGNQVPQNSR